MNLFLTRIFNNPLQAPTIQPKQDRRYVPNFNGLEKDTFVRTTPTFAGRSSKTKAGGVLKELDDITCPYSGVKMLSGNKMTRVENRLANCPDLYESMQVLNPYKSCMQKLEKQIYGEFKVYEKLHPGATANDCLRELRPECLAKLRIEEFQVLDNIDNISNNLSPVEALKIRRLTTNARKRILDDKDNQIFKRKDLLDNLEVVTQNFKNKKLVHDISEVANKLPKSSTNFNAFVVKYADRSQTEIMARLLRPSVASIEHITPKSINPDHTLANFMLAAKDWNTDRGNMPLPEYIDKHPNIPVYSQRYANDIIKAIHNKKLQNVDWYPYMLKEKLYNESEGIIQIKLDNYKISEEEAFKDAAPELIEKYNDVKEANKVIEPKQF